MVKELKIHIFLPSVVFFHCDCFTSVGLYLHEFARFRMVSVSSGQMVHFNIFQIYLCQQKYRGCFSADWINCYCGQRIQRCSKTIRFCLFPSMVTTNEAPIISFKNLVSLSVLKCLTV